MQTAGLGASVSSLDNSDQKICPETKAGIFSQLTSSWLNSLLSVGYKRPLEISDLQILGSHYHTLVNKELLGDAWNKQLAGSVTTSKWPLFWAISDAYSGPFYLTGIAKFVADTVALASPYLLKMLIENIKESSYLKALIFFESEENNMRMKGYLLCGLIFIFQVLNTVLVTWYFTQNARSGFRVRTALNGLLYEKSLKLSGRARQQFSTGQMINLMTNDSSRLEMAALFVHYIWSGPFQIFVILALLFKLIGWSVLVGFTIFLVFFPIQAKIAAWLGKFRKETSQVSDKRVKLMQEIIQGIRVIKYYAWEKSFLSNLFDLRQIELDRVKKAQNLRNLTGAITISVPIFSTILTFLIYHYLGYDLKPEIVFPVMTYFNQLRLPLVLLPMVISMMVDAKVALKRLQDFLMAEELQFEPVVDPDSKEAISIENGVFEWEDVTKNGPASNLSTANLLVNESTTVLDKVHSQLGPLNISIPKGSLVAIVGPVGSGKSSLLNAIVGEMKYISGKVILGGSLGYSPQQSWIQNKNVKDNILFGRPFDEDRYTEVLRACALEKDLQSLPDGDLTEIGEKGVNISGGQKQRISLARIIYSQNDIVLLDDPLSAVDAHVGKHIFDHCINGLLKYKTRVLVTHQLHLLPQVDYIIVMENMKLSMQGTMSELLKYESSFATLMKDHGRLQNDEAEKNKVEEKQKENVIASSEKPLPRNGKAKKLVTVEERLTGAVAWSVYQSYIEWGGGASFIGSILVLMALYNGARILNDLWLSFWTEHPPRFNLSNFTWASAYLGFGISQALFGFFLGMVFAVCGVKASSTLHCHAATQVVHSPISFFDQNPLGRIINRFSKDQDTVDNQLPESLRSLMTMLGTAFTAFALISLISWSFVPPLIVLIVVYYWIQNFYRASSRELKRLDALTRSPLYAQYSETLTGLATIRAFRDQERFIQTFNTLADKQNQPAFLQMSALRWLGLRLETIGNFLVLAACLSCYIFRVSASQTGLAVGYSLSVSGVLNWLVRQLSETETNVIASERLGQYAQLKDEEDEKVPVEDETQVNIPKDLPEDWPKQGTVSFEHLTLKYRPGLPPVLKDITFSVKSGERIGIIGRTGAGKSSIMTVLFQMVRQSSGKIFIDGQDIYQIPLERLRKSISIIPQDPVVFSGTIRSNLDPFSQYTDAQIWSALKQGYLSDAVSKMEGGLEAVVQEGGENLSVGQRQLLCLVRAILRRNRIIVLDEATANIDLATDALIQASLRRDFPGCTLLTIAHRLNTVIDYDKILGIETGCVVEFGAPADLLLDPKSLLSTLVKETGASNEALLKSKAQPSSSIE